MSMRFVLATGAACAVAAPALATPLVDGSIAGDLYGNALSVQTVQTQFGDNISELNAAYGVIDGGRLYLSLTGNLEDNFNKLEIFIDSAAGGENTLSGAPGNDGTGVMTGLTFDTGFDADYHLILRRGAQQFDLDYSALGTANFSSYTDVFGGVIEGSGATGTGANASPIEVGYDNSNVAGILGGNGPADQAAALAVLTGIELSIDLADLGSPVGDFRIMAFVNGSNHDFVSNQFLGGLMPPQGNLGGDGTGNWTGSVNFNLNDFAGNQFFVIPAPGTISLFALGSFAVLRRRR